MEREHRKPRYKIIFELEGTRVESVRKKLEQLLGVDSEVVKRVSLIGKVESRADRLQAAHERVEEAQGEVESLRDEMQEWYDNMPESFQGGDKGDTCQQAADALDELASNIGDLDFDSIEFPGMY